MILWLHISFLIKIRFKNNPIVLLLDQKALILTFHANILTTQ